MLIDALEVSIVVVTLPVIAGDLHLSPWTVQFLMSGFALGFATCLLLGPRLAQRWGRRPVYLAAMVLFVVASVVGGVASTPALLIGTRVVKAMCAALTAPTGLVIISSTFRPGPDQRRAVSTYAAFGAAGFSAGLLLSSVLAGTSWRLPLLVTAPVALLLLIAASVLLPRRAMPEQRKRASARTLLTNGALVRSAVGAASLNGSHLALLLLLTFRLQVGAGWQPWQAALVFLPTCLPVAICAPFASRLVTRWSAPRLIAAGAVVLLVGAVSLLWRSGSLSSARPQVHDYV
ncbi:MFS transporter [Amycolatopsis sp. NPDC051903]|uniref:MFS transporter n=1 Tax=Amycolatopsis sp. NPDC051903 TaxID=3363936 RepID=UPI0037BC4B44